MLRRFPIAVAGLFSVAAWLGGAAAAHADEAGIKPGAAITQPDEATKAAVAARRGKTALSRLAEAMKPGTWAELRTEMPPRLWTSPPPSRGLHIAGWTDDAHWDSRTGQFLYMGLRQTRQFIAYSEEKNAWRVIALDPKGDNPCFRTAFGHVYGSNGFDHARGRFYHRYNSFKSETEGLDLPGGISYFDAVTEKWTKLPPAPANSGFTGMAIEYFAAMDGLVILGRQAWLFSNQRQKWECLGNSPVDGYHSLFRHNPFRDEVLMGGGNNNRQVLARLTKAGKIERLKDLPRPFAVSADKFTIDPASGRYLMLGFTGADPMQAFEFDSDKNEYRAVDAISTQWPYKRGAMPVCAFIPEYGVIMWAEPTGVHLYKHDPSKTAPITPPAPAAPAK